MTENEIWNLIDGDRPRLWEVFVNGHWFAREMATSAEDLLESCVGWLVEAYRFECRHGQSVKAKVEVLCRQTCERVKAELQVEV